MSDLSGSLSWLSILLASQIVETTEERLLKPPCKGPENEHLHLHCHYILKNKQRRTCWNVRFTCRKGASYYYCWARNDKQKVGLKIDLKGKGIGWSSTSWSPNSLIQKSIWNPPKEIPIKTWKVEQNTNICWFSLTSWRVIVEHNFSFSCMFCRRSFDEIYVRMFS